MPEIKRVFVRGRMNKDADERMVPNGEYRDALNLDLSVSEGSDVGAFENIKGNTEIIHKSYSASTLTFTDWDSNYISDLSNASCVGAIADSETEMIYWFIASDEVNAIAQYNQGLDVVTPLLIEKKTISNFLNFTADNIITGINILKGILFWTDNKTEPKKIVIADWQNSTSTFLNHSQIYGRNFIEQDITVIKKYPLTAPALELKKSKREGNIETTINFQFTTLNQEDELITLDSESPDQTFNFSTAMDYREGDILKLSIIDQNNEFNEDYEVRVTITSVINIYRVKVKILSISSGIPTGILPYDVSLILDDPLFEFKFPRFATRYKYKDNQYSVFSPFSEVGFLPGDKFDFDSKNAYNLAMINTARSILIKDFVPSNIPLDVVAIDILYKETGNNAVYKVDTIEKDSDKWNSNKYEVESEIISSIIEANQILRPFDNVPKVALTQEIVANRLIYGNYKQNYNMLTSQGEIVAPEFAFRIEEKAATFPATSIKSQRTYQLGIVYIDEYGRQSPVFTSDTATKTLNKSFAPLATTIKNHMLSDAPSWAKYFKYFIKENSSEYYNLAMDRWYNAEDGNIWMSFASSDRDKLNQQTFIELKKEHDTSTPVTVPAKYKVISLSNNAPEFLKLSKKQNGSGEITLLEDGFPLIDGANFQITKASEWTGTSFDGLESFDQDLFVVLSNSTNQSEEFEVSNITDLGSVVQINLRKKFDNSIDFIASNNSWATKLIDKVNVTFYKESSTSKPEYDGKFFAKIFKDSTLEENLLKTKNADSYSVVINKPLGENTSDSRDRDFRIPRSGWRIENGAPYKFHAWPTRDEKEFERRGVGIKVGSKKISIAHFKDGLGNFSRDGNGFDSSAYQNRMGNDFGVISDTEESAFIDSISATGTYFRFQDDPDGTIYEIKKSRRIHLCYSDSATKSQQGQFASGRAYRWDLTLDKAIVWSPESIINNNCTDSSYDSGSCVRSAIQILKSYFEDGDTFSVKNPAIWETEPKESVDLDLYYAASDIYPIGEHNDVKELNWHNCWSFGNGIESNRIRDDFAATYLDNNPIASTVLEEPYAEEHRSTGLIFSQIFNSQSGINNLNQFILAEAITKDLNPRHGSIQKLHARDTDMITLCEDKCFYILANKDALFNADGSANVTSNNAVLGLARPYAGDFGISKNPESFAAYSNKIYFTDKNRGVVIRLSGGLGGGDGITIISDKGMSDYFEDNLQLNTKLIGSYDKTSGAYNLVLNNQSSTLSYQEAVDGWTTRFSFLKEQGLSLNNKYYTFKDGRIWLHKSSDTYNNFYGTQYNSSFTVLLNDQPSSVKNFKTLDYTGTESRDYKYETGNGVKYSLAEIQANQLIPTSQQTTEGWFVESINTDLQEGEVKTFLNKEGKYFNYIKGTATTLSNIDSKEFSVQGIGRAVVSGDNQSEFNVHVYVDDTCFIGNYKVHVFVDDTCYINN